MPPLQNPGEKSDVLGDQSSNHWRRVRQFMSLAKQGTPASPIWPSSQTALLRARLILEEAIETIEALGIRATISTAYEKKVPLVNHTLHFEKVRDPDLAGIVDGCCDLSVVTIGTLIACGVPDTPFIELVDENNLEKFGPGHAISPAGKLLKPPGHKPPDIQKALDQLAIDCTEN